VCTIFIELIHCDHPLFKIQFQQTIGIIYSLTTKNQKQSSLPNIIIIIKSCNRKPESQLKVRKEKNKGTLGQKPTFYPEITKNSGFEKCEFRQK